MGDLGIHSAQERVIPGSDPGTGAAILRLIEEKEALRVRAIEAEEELALWRTGKMAWDRMPDGSPCIMTRPDDPFAEIRDSETGEVIFPSRKRPFVLIDGGKLDDTGDDQ